MFFYSLSWYSLNPLLEAYALQFWEIFLEIVFYSFFLICLSSHFLGLLCCILKLPDLLSNFLSFSLSLDIFLLFGSLSGKFSWLDLPTFEMKFLFWLSFLIFKHSFFFFNPKINFLFLITMQPFHLLFHNGYYCSVLKMFFFCPLPFSVHFFLYLGFCLTSWRLTESCLLPTISTLHPVMCLLGNGSLWPASGDWSLWPAPGGSLALWLLVGFG